MKKLSIFGILILLCGAAHAQGGLWTGILTPTNGGSPCTLLPTGTYAACAPPTPDWSAVGVPGGIPTGTQAGSTIQSTGGGSNCTNSTTDCTAVINAALSSCGGTSSAEKYVLLGTGTFQFNGTITIPSYCYLNMSGANNTILKQGGSSAVINVGGNNYFSAGTTGSPNLYSVYVNSGATAGSQSIVVASSTGMAQGQLMAISELNNPTYVDITGSEGIGSGFFCVYQWGDGSNNDGRMRSRCQIVEITSVSGTTVNFSPPLITDYGGTAPNWAATTYYGYDAFITNGGHLYQQTATSNAHSSYHCLSGSSTPGFSTSGGSVNDGISSPVQYCTWLDLGAGTTLKAAVLTSNHATGTPSYSAGIANGQIYDIGTTGTPDVSMTLCMSCFVKGNEFNYTNADWVDVYQSLWAEVRDNYFTNSFNHNAGGYDATNRFFHGTTNSLFENNICERGHVGCMLFEEGSTGNVIGYNFVTGNFPGQSTSSSPYQGWWNIEALNYHAAHPQFNLAEGNVWNTTRADSVWGTSSHGTHFRNWDVGTTFVCNPQTQTVTRGTVTCIPTSPYPQASNGSYNSQYNYQQGQGLELSYAANFFNIIGEVVGSAQAQSSAFKTSSNTTVTQNPTIVWPTTRVYDGDWYGTTFGFSESSDTGSFVLDSARPFTTALIHGLYNNENGSTTWQSPITHTLPASFYKSSQPSWWSLPCWPCIGPDVTTGNGPGTHTYLTASNMAQSCYYNVMGGSDGGAASPLVFNAASCYSATSNPIANLTPSSLTYSAQAIGTTSASQTLTLSNTGTATLTIASIVASGDYGKTTTCSGTLAAAANCTIAVTFTPTASGTRTGSIVVTDNSGGVGGSTQTTSLSGTGILPTAASPTASPIAGTYTATQSVTLTTSSGGAIICWNLTGGPATNGTTGCVAGSNLYTGSVTIAITGNLYAVAGGTGYQDSSVMTAGYIINASPAPVVYSARQDNCVTGSESGCSGLPTGFTGAPLSFRYRPADVAPFPDITTGNAGVGAMAFDADFGATLVMATDETTASNCAGSATPWGASWGMGSDGEYDAFSTDSTLLLVSNQNGTDCVLLLNPVSIHAKKCVAVACVTNIGIGSAGGSPLLHGTGFAFSRVSTETNVLYSLETNGQEADRNYICLTTGSPNCGSTPAGCTKYGGSTNFVITCPYVDINNVNTTVLGSSLVQCAGNTTPYAPPPATAAWTSSFQVGNDGSVSWATGQAQDWQAAWTPTLNECFILPAAGSGSTNAGKYAYQPTAVTGPTSGSPPTWCQVSSPACTVTDGGVTWTNIGKINGQGPGFDTFFYHPGAGGGRINHRVGKMYNSANRIAPAGLLQTTDTTACSRYGTNPCTLTDLYTLHASGMTANGRYIVITPTGSEGALATGNWNSGTLSGQISSAVWSGVAGGECNPTGVYANCSSTATFPAHHIVAANGFFYTALLTNGPTTCSGSPCPPPTPPTLTNTYWSQTEAYPTYYVIDSYSNTAYVCGWSACEGHVAHGYVGLAQGSKYKYSNYANGMVQGALSPGTQFLASTLPCDDHGTWRQSGNTDANPVFLATNCVPMSNLTYTGSFYGEVNAVQPVASGTGYRFSHASFTGPSQYFSDQSNICVVSYLGDLVACGGDMWGTRGDISASNITCAKVSGGIYHYTGTYAPGSGLTLLTSDPNNSNQPDVIMPLPGSGVTANPGNYLYYVSTQGTGTTTSTIPSWSTCQTLGCTINYTTTGTPATLTAVLNTCRSDVGITDVLSAQPLQAPNVGPAVMFAKGWNDETRHTASVR